MHVGSTAFLGVEISPSGTGILGVGNPTGSGATVAGIIPGSAAAQAGLTQGDQITSLAGHAITSSSDLSSELAHYHPGNKVSISWTNPSGQSHTATVTLTTGPAGRPATGPAYDGRPLAARALPGGIRAARSWTRRPARHGFDRLSVARH